MAYTMSIRFTRASVFADGTPDRVILISWAAYKSEGDINAVVPRRTDIPLSYAPASVAYNTIVEQDCKDWVVDIVGDANIEAMLDTNLAVQAQPEVIEGLPWENQYILWSVGVSVIIGDVRAFTTGANSELVNYECQQPHTTASNSTPPKTPALWTVYRPDGSISEWIQPTGAQDAYDLDELVYWTNINEGGAEWVYQSTFDGNATEPGTDGIFDRWWTPIEPYTP
jgi:hypothetical protein